MVTISNINPQKVAFSKIIGERLPSELVQKPISHQVNSFGIGGFVPGIEVS